MTKLNLSSECKVGLAQYFSTFSHYCPTDIFSPIVLSLDIPPPQQNIMTRKLILIQSTNLTHISPVLHVLRYVIFSSMSCYQCVGCVSTITVRMQNSSITTRNVDLLYSFLPFPLMPCS